MKTIKDIDVKGKKVILRADYNVPTDNGEITDDYRIIQGLPTLEYLIKQDCQVVIISHLGRPEGKPDPQYSLQNVAKHLSSLVKQPVAFVADLEDVDSTSQITLLENLRFWPGEESNDDNFAKQIAGLGDVFVQDGFGVVHRAHASTVAITKFLPAVAGLLLEKEVNTITDSIENPKRPLVAIVGGAKISDKLKVLHSLIPKVDRLIIGGGMANTFLINSPEHDVSTIGKSLHEDNMAREIADIYATIAEKFGVKAEDNPDDYSDSRVRDFIYLPRDDIAVGKDISPDEKAKVIPISVISEDDIVLDFGPESLEGAIKIVQSAETIIWNGPLGMIELPEFAKSSHKLAEAIVESEASSIVGGGDTAGFIQQLGMIDDFSWVSTGGGAALDLMTGEELPGITSLET
ncbi:MAG: phosphoglycerate kinase [Candidatus Saccharimonadales bacterium]